MVWCCMLCPKTILIGCSKSIQKARPDPTQRERAEDTTVPECVLGKESHPFAGFRWSLLPRRALQPLPAKPASTEPSLPVALVAEPPGVVGCLGCRQFSLPGRATPPSLPSGRASPPRVLRGGPLPDLPSAFGQPLPPSPGTQPPARRGPVGTHNPSGTQLSPMHHPPATAKPPPCHCPHAVRTRGAQPVGKLGRSAGSTPVRRSPK